MARPLRFEQAGGWYHITSRGNERRAIFRDDRDRLHWCETVGRMVEQFHVAVHAYVLMGNHYHLLLELQELNLSEALQWLNVSYAAWFNRRHQRVGHLFQGRFKSIVVEPEGWGWELTRYIHLNPVRTARLGLGKDQRQADRLGVGEKPLRSQVQERLEVLRGYRWSSYRAYIGTSKAAPWLTAGRVLSMGRSPQGQARARYRRFVEQAIVQGLEKTPWESLKEGLVLGSQRLLARVQGVDAVGDRVKGIAEKHWSRPTWDQTVRVVEESCGQKWEQFRDRHRDRGRDLALSLARSQGRMTLRELAEMAGMRSEAAVNLAIKRYQRIVETDALEAKRAERCIARLNKIGEMLNV